MTLSLQMICNGQTLVERGRNLSVKPLGKIELTPENGWRLSAVYQHGYRLERVAAAAAQ